MIIDGKTFICVILEEQSYDKLKKMLVGILEAHGCQPAPIIADEIILAFEKEIEDLEYDEEV